ncbi:beta-ketoacyl-ACP synthase III [Engelhardtia mirabilis]|uniref:Beta-ketoacyl-[acyl-carrier-protein] synthase III n=1 Tax=Engelhardtia mirabilis TaxID=2528011 RepID=A0A518BKN1_9BACT|nr:3-oxoacyl-[acyl-carrier-protein] synthase 3 [Planctomycetes bacterium Pla133]QDV01855.1 3-oxoacyl-[acyl-carrier-protein] synthase 3 [Planctomycetes bacterium Pla86]
MAGIRPVGFAGTGSYLPDRVVPNSWFEGFLDTSDEWIVQRTGIRERRFASEGETTSTMCIEAGKRACEAASIDPKDLDLVVVGTLTGDYQMPSTACMVQDALGCKNAAAFDVSAACTGFLNATHVAEAMIATGKAQRALAIGAETLSRFLDYTDRGSCVLFGDGAGAAVLTPFDQCKRGEIIKTKLGADGEKFDFIIIPGTGSKQPPSPEGLANGDHLIHLKGRDVFRFATVKMAELIGEMLEGIEEEELGLIVPHQVNRRIIDAALDRLGRTDEKVIVNIQHYANTSAATVPIALDEAVRAGSIESGKYVVLVAFGAGMTWGASLLRW